MSTMTMEGTLTQEWVNMAAVNRDSSAANTILATRADYQPLDSYSMDETARWMRNRSYEQAEAKQERKRKSAEKMSSIYEMGLPRQMQGKLNYMVEDIYKKVDSVEIDVDDPSFNIELAKIKGKAKQYGDIVTMVKSAISEDNFLIQKDEEGNDIDKKSEFEDKFMGLYNEFNPEQDDVDDKIPTFIDDFSKLSKPIELDLKGAVETASKLKTMNDDQFAEWAASRDGSMMGTKTTKFITPPEKRALIKEVLRSEYELALRNKYAALGSKQGTGISMPDYIDQNLEAIIGRDTSKEEKTVDPAAQEASRVAAAKVGKEEEVFSTSKTPITRDQALERFKTLMPAGSIEGETATGERSYIPRDWKWEDADVITINPAKKGTPLKPIVVDGVEGVVEELHLDSKGNGFAILTRPVSVTTGSTKDGGTQTSTKKTERVLVKVDEAERKKIEGFYGISILGDSAKGNEQEETLSVAEQMRRAAQQTK